MRKSRRGGLIAACGSICWAAAMFAACGNDDSASPASDGGSDTGRDATSNGDATTDAGKLDARSADAANEASTGPRAHFVFITSGLIQGDFGAAALDAGLPADGGTSLAAADAICQHAAGSAGLPGTYFAVVKSATEDGFARFRDGDGPWGRIDNYPVAENASDLITGRWHSPINRTEQGTTSTDFVWGGGIANNDCSNWTNGFADAGGVAGQPFLISPDALSDTVNLCSTPGALYCAEVGDGGGPNQYPTPPVGAKVAFATDLLFPGNLTSPAAGVLDGGAPDAGDDVHSVADALCNQAARGAGRSGKFHAWISSTTIDAKTKFTSLSMNGPWYRPDGFEVAGSLAELTTTGTRTQIALGADGTFPATLQNWAWTGTDSSGAVDANNCTDFTSKASGVKSRMGSSEYSGSQALSVVLVSCNNPGKLMCFEE